MLSERTATATRHDNVTDAFEIELSTGAGAAAFGLAAFRRWPSTGTLLLDREGALVGVDLRQEPRVKAVIMLGRHEAVARTVSGRLELIVDAREEVARVRVLDASTIAARR